MLRLLIGLLVSAVWAASPTVSGPEGARSIVLLAPGEQGEISALCTDDGHDPDEVPGDGIWGCGELPLRAGARLGVLVDGGALTVVEIQEAPAARPHIDLERKRLGPAATPGDPGPPTRGMPALVIEVELGAGAHAWQLQARQGGGEGVEYRCGDDGAFPDAMHNDEIATCSGVAPGDVLSLSLRSGQGQEQTGEIRWPPGAGVLLGRWGEDGVERAEWAIVKPRAAESAPSDPGSPGASDAGTSRPDGPRGEDPRGDGGGAGGPPSGSADASGGRGASPWLALLGAALAGGIAWRVWRGPAARRTPSGAEAVHPPGPRTERRSVTSLAEGLAEAVRERAAVGPVVLVLPPQIEARWAPGGPVLRATSRDALDVRDTVDELLARDPLCAPTVVIAGATTLVNPDGLGVPPAEQLLLRAPPAVRVLELVLEPSSGGEE